MKCDKCGKELLKSENECLYCNSVVVKAVAEDTNKVKNSSWITELFSKVDFKPINFPKNMATTVYGMPPISSRAIEEIDYARIKDEKLCQHCKSKIKLNDKVCPKCGKKLGFATLRELEK